MSAESWRARIQDILTAVAKLDSLTAGLAFDEFREHPSALPATLYYLTVIGEAATRLPEEIVQRYPEIPWAEVRAQRNFIVHRYSEVDPEVIWDTLRNDVPSLRPFLPAVLDHEP